jgi:PmbA protein
MDYLQIAQSVIEQAQAAGAQAEAYIQMGQETEVQVDRGQVEKLSQAGSKGIGIRVIKNGRMGYAYTSDFSPGSLKKSTEIALTLAEVTDSDEYRLLPDPRPLADEDLQIYDPAVEATPIDDKIAFAKTLEAAALAADTRVMMTNRATYFDSVSRVYLANSKGFASSYEKSFVGGFLMAIAHQDQERATAFGLGTSAFIGRLDAHKIGTEAGEKAARLLDGKPAPTQKATVVYSPLAVIGLIGALAQALTAEAMQRNRSFLLGKLNQDVASDRVTILDNGRLPGGLATRPFDDEGNPTHATRLIDEGVLRAVLYDTYTAAKESGQSTGNAGRYSHRQPPGLMASNFYIQPGHQTPEEIIAGVERGFYVVNTMNSHSINPINGDYSVSAQGFWIENGRLSYPVNEVTIALPLAQWLKNVSAVGNDLTFLPFGGSIGAPTIRVDEIMIGGRG